MPRVALSENITSLRDWKMHLMPSPYSSQETTRENCSSRSLCPLPCCRVNLYDHQGPSGFRLSCETLSGDRPSSLWLCREERERRAGIIDARSSEARTNLKRRMSMLPSEHCSVIILWHRQMAGKRIIVRLIFHSDLISGVLQFMQAS